MNTNSIASQIDKVRQNLTDSFEKLSASDAEKHKSMLAAVDDYFAAQENRNQARHDEVLRWLRYVCDNLGVPLPPEFANAPETENKTETSETNNTSDDSETKDKSDAIAGKSPEGNVDPSQPALQEQTESSPAALTPAPEKTEALPDVNKIAEDLKSKIDYQAVPAEDVLGPNSMEDVRALKRKKYLAGNEDVYEALKDFVENKLNPRDIAQIMQDDDGHIYVVFEDGFETGPSPSISSPEDEAYKAFTKQLSVYALNLLMK